MKARVRVGALAAMMATSLLATPMQAQAVLPGLSVGAAVFIGKATVAPAICDPASSLVGVCGAKKGIVHAFTFDAGPNVCCANGTPTACAGAVVHPKKGAGATASVPPLGHCDISAAGFVAPVAGLGPWCGLSSGFGVGGTIDYSKGKVYAFGGGFWPVAVGGTIVFVAVGPGGKAKGLGLGATVAIVNAQPDLPFKGMSCRQFMPPGPGATDFLVQGAVLFVAV